MKQTSKVLSILLALLMICSMMSSVSAAGLALQSATIDGTPIAEAAEIRSNAEILLTFNADVTDDSVLANNISKINIKDSAGQNVSSVSVSASGTKKFTVALGGLEKANYTLTIGEKFKDKDGNQLGTKVEIPFTVNRGDGTGSGGGNNPLSFVSAKVGDADLAGATVEATGTITITFDRGMTENQADNFAQISILDKDGKKVDGVTFSDFTKDDAGNSYTVLSYKDLAAGDYTLKLGKDLKANNGNTLGKAVTVNFTVKTAESKDDDKVSGITTMINAILNVIKSIFNFFAKLFK